MSWSASPRRLALASGVTALVLLVASCSSSGSGSAGSSSPSPASSAASQQPSDSQSGSASSSPASPGSATGGSSGSAPDSITVAWTEAVATLDPYRSTDNVTVWMDSLIGGQLVESDSAGKVSPGIAESWTTSSDNLTYTFKLRSDVTFSNGTPITSADVVDTYTHVMADKANVRAGEVAAWKTVSATDPQTFALTLSAPQPSLLNILSQPEMSIFPKGSLDDPEKFFLNPVSAGEYAVKSYQPNGESITLERNDHYYGPEPAIKTFIYKRVPDAATRIIDLKSGSIDVALDLPAAAVNQADTPTTDAVAAKVYGNQWIWMNDRTGPLSEVNVRKAINLAVDREQINQLAFAGKTVPVGSIWPVTMSEHDISGDLIPMKVDIAKAKQLLQGTKCQNGCTLEIMVRQGVPIDQSSALVIKQNLAKIGITVNVVGVDTTTASQNESAGTFQMEAHKMTSNLDIPDNYLNLCCLSTGGIHNLFSGWSSSEMDAAVKEVLSNGGQARTDAIKKIDKIFADQLPYIPLVNYVIFAGVSKKVASWFEITPGFVLDIKSAAK